MDRRSFLLKAAAVAAAPAGVALASNPSPTDAARSAEVMTDAAAPEFVTADEFEPWLRLLNELRPTRCLRPLPEEDVAALAKIVRHGYMSERQAVSFIWDVGENDPPVSEVLKRFDPAAAGFRVEIKAWRKLVRGLES